MDRMICPDCAWEVSRTVPACPKCGCEIRRWSSESWPIVCTIAVLAVSVAAVLAVVLVGVGWH